MIGDLDYKTAARAVYWLIQNYKWSHPPTVGEIRERAGIIDKRERDRLAYARNKAERRAIEDLREKGEDPLPKSVRELIQRVKSIPGAESGNGKEKAEPLSPAEIEARKRVLRQQASYLIEQERLTA